MYRQRQKEIFQQNCKKARGLAPDVSRRIGDACWALADYKFGDLRQFGGRDMKEMLPKEAFERVNTVRAKAEELFSMILEY